MRAIAIALVLGAVGCSGSATTGSSGPAGLDVVLEASTAQFAFSDGKAGQTAHNVTAGLRSLTLLPDGGGAGFTLFDRGADEIVTGYDDGSTTPLGLVAPADIVPGHYTRIRMVQDWTRFDIDATLHDADGATAGSLHVVTVTSDGSTVDGQAQDAGYYDHTFSASGGKTGHWTGSDAVVPAHSQTAGAEAIVENGEWAVYFPADITVTSGNATLRIVANMDHAFRWTDTPGGDNQDGVYDIAPPLYETVEQFGANRFDVTLTSR